jgi:hypothetical protein
VAHENPSGEARSGAYQLTPAGRHYCAEDVRTDRGTLSGAAQGP